MLVKYINISFTNDESEIWDVMISLSLVLNRAFPTFSTFSLPFQMYQV